MRTWRWLLQAALLFTFAGASDGEVPAYRVRVSVEIIALKSQSALPLVSRLRVNHSMPKALQEVDALVRSGQAELIDWPSVVLASGERGLCETIEEFRYPTEFEPPQVPGSAFWPLPEPARKPLWGAIVPSSFETRNIATMLDLSATVSAKGDEITLEIVPIHVLFDGMELFDGQADAFEIRGQGVQPRRRERKEANVRVQSPALFLPSRLPNSSSSFPRLDSPGDWPQ